MMLFDLCLIPLLCACSAPGRALRCPPAAHQPARCGICRERRSSFTGAENALIAAPTDQEYFREAESWDSGSGGAAIDAAHASRGGWRGRDGCARWRARSRSLLLMPLKQVDPFLCGWITVRAS